MEGEILMDTGHIKTVIAVCRALKAASSRNSDCARVNAAIAQVQVAVLSLGIRFGN